MRCTECEEPVDVVDLCEECEKSDRVIEPGQFRLCGRGHAMSWSGLRWHCDACRRMRHAAYRSLAREQRLWKEVHS